MIPSEVHMNLVQDLELEPMVSINGVQLHFSKCTAVVVDSF